MTMTHMRKRTLVIAGIIAALILLFWFMSRAEPVRVIVKEVDQGTVESTVANTRAGTVNACQRARLAPASGGQIARLPVKEGDQVKAGQLLLEIWNEDIAAELLFAKHETKTKQAQSEEACIKADVTQREAERLRKLLKRKLASEEKADRAIGDAKSAAAACKAAKASILVSVARVAMAKAALERTILRAPFDGTVAEVNGELGEFITPSPVGVPTLPAIDLVDNSCLYVTASIDEVDAPAIRAGMPARITLDAFKKRTFPAKVRRVAPYVLDREKQARTVDIEADFANPQDIQNLLAGYSADVEVILSVKKNAIRVPTEAIKDNNTVLIFDDGVLEERTIETGISNWIFTEIIKGVSVGEQVVTSVDREGVVPGADALLEK